MNLPVGGHGQTGQASTIGDVTLAENGSEMIHYGMVADEELARNNLVTEALAHKVNHLDLSQVRPNSLR